MARKKRRSARPFWIRYRKIGWVRRGVAALVGVPLLAAACSMFFGAIATGTWQLAVGGLLVLAIGGPLVFAAAVGRSPEHLKGLYMDVGLLFWPF